MLTSLFLKSNNSEQPVIVGTSIMERQGIIKTLILLFAVGIFIFQMQNSIRKYLARPVVQMKSSVPVQDITLPVVYICQV